MNRIHDLNPPAGIVDRIAGRSPRPFQSLGIATLALFLWAGTAQPGAATSLSGTTLSANITTAYNNGQASYVVPADTYTLASPHDANQYVSLSNLTRTFTVDFSGSTFILDQSLPGFLALNTCQNLTVKNATVRYATPPFTQGTVVGITNGGLTYEVALDTGYPQFNDPVHFPTTGQALARLFSSSNRLLKRWTGDLACNANWTRNATTGHYFFTWATASPNAAVGDLIGIRGLGQHAIMMNRCGGTTLKALTINASPAFNVYDFYASAQNFINNVTVIRDANPPAGATALPLISSCADGFHSVGGRQGPSITGCNLSHMQDDAIAIHGRYSVLTGYTGSTKTLIMSDGVLNQAGDLVSGDLLRFYDLNMNPLGAATVSTVTKLTGYTPGANSTRSGFTSWTGHSFYQIVLTTAPTFTPSFDNAVMSPDRSSSGYTVSSTNVSYNRENGITAKADNGTITNCIFNGSSGSGVLLFPFFPEGDYSENVTVTGCIIVNCGYDKNVPPSVQINGVGTVPAHYNINFTNNTIRAADGYNLWISQADTVSITGNTFDYPCTGVPANQSLVRIGNTNAVTLNGNIVTHAGTYLNQSALVATFGTNTNPSGFATGITVQP